MRGTVTETIDQVGMTGLSVKIGLKEKIDQHVKIDRVVKTEVAANNEENVAEGITVKLVETGVGGKTVLVTMIVEAVITVVTNMGITTGIALNVRIPTSPSAQNAIAVASLKVRVEAEDAAMIAEIIPVAVKAGAVIVEINTVTMIGIALSVKTRILVSVLNVIGVANPKAKVARIATAVVKVIAEEERVVHAVMLSRELVINVIVDPRESTN